MISFDLDMTLLDHRTGKITPSALTAIQKLRKNHRIVLATGRDMDNYYSAKYKELLAPDAIVHMNGTKVTAGEQLLYEHLFDKKLLRELLEYCDKNGFAIGMTEGDEDYYIHPEIVTESDIRRFGSCGRRYKDPWNMLQKRIRTLAFIGEEFQITQLEKRFPQLKMPLFAGRGGADVMEVGFSKADGLRCLARYFGENEDLSDTVAFGDSMNDLEVICEAGTGVAMGNAVEELKIAADLVTAPIDEDGVYLACLKLGLIPSDNCR